MLLFSTTTFIVKVSVERVLLLLQLYFTKFFHTLLAMSTRETCDFVTTACFTGSVIVYFITAKLTKLQVKEKVSSDSK